MDIDLSLLHSSTVEVIDINNSYELTKDYYENTDIRELSSIDVVGQITRKENENNELNDYIECTIKGEMLIPDSITLDTVTYPFTIEYSDFIDENSLKNENMLDILAFLWENIVLEIPLQFTKEVDYSKFQGNGWRLISEEELKKENNPFNELLNDIEKE
ncbi:MAG: hypothetical protein IJG97_03965 [Bacilli bacterium]|nr:hypothetical protein [Bacilli bacterium]